MSDLEPRRSSGLSRQRRADRAYTLVKVAGGLAIATIVLAILAVLGIVGAAWPVILGALSVGAGVALRRTLNT